MTPIEVLEAQFRGLLDANVDPRVIVTAFHNAVAHDPWGNWDEEQLAEVFQNLDTLLATLGGSQ